MSTKPPKRTYQDVVKCFQDEGCQMLTTEEECNAMKLAKISSPKYNYVASCGHEHCVFFNSFVSRKSGILCPQCIVTRNSKRIKNNMSNNKLVYLELELRCIDYFIDITKNDFIVKKAFDGCKADIIMKPIHCLQDEWIGIQVKTCSKPLLDYGFHVANDYSNMLILCISESDKKMWGIPYDLVAGQTKVTMGLTKSKYSKFELTLATIAEQLFEIYKSLDKNIYEVLNTPICIYQQREKAYREYREEKIDFIEFTNSRMEGLVYDFHIGDKKVQEKVGGPSIRNSNEYHFTLVKNNGNKTKQQNLIQYEIGDNDFYWLNCDNKKHFYVIPEDELVEHGFIDNKKQCKKMLSINITKENTWLTPYAFHYDNIDKERLLSIVE
jgi:hypothetical protein